MKRFLAYICVIIASLSIYQNAHTEPTINMFFRSFPEIYPNEHAQELEAKLKKPGKIARHTIRSLTNSNIVAGIYVTYGGYLDVSDVNGEIRFPRKHKEAKVILVITTKITPIMMVGNTIHHWEFEEGTPVSLYSVERKQDEETKLLYWDVKAIPAPENNRLPLESLVVFGKPKDVYIPEGITLTTEGPQLLLPDIYVKKGIKQYERALYLLNLKHFFGPVTVYSKKEPKRYLSRLSY